MVNVTYVTVLCGYVYSSLCGYMFVKNIGKIMVNIFIVRVYGCMWCVDHTIHLIWSQDSVQHCTHSGSI